MAIRMFISYATPDKKFVDRLELMIRSTFRDEILPKISAYDMNAGGSISQKVRSGILECEWFLVLLTENSALNPTVMFETGYAYRLYDEGSIECFIPVIERKENSSGDHKDMIEAGIFIGKDIESASYASDERLWESNLGNIRAYLLAAFNKSQQPNHMILKERALKLSANGMHWEAAGHFRRAAEDLISEEQTESAIEAYRDSIHQYVKGDYLWEAAEQWGMIAQLEEERKQIESSIQAVVQKAKIYQEAGEKWEAAATYQRAGERYHDLGKKDEWKQYLLKAIEMYESGGYSAEAMSLRELLDEEDDEENHDESLE